MGKGFVVPKGAIFKDEPSARFAQSTPTLSFVSMTSYPSRGIKITTKAKILLMWCEIGIGRVHVSFWWVGWIAVK
jgi:hypothetical protein